MEPRKTVRRSKIGEDATLQYAASTKVGVKAMTGNAAYREEYQYDNGPDLDEPLDITESGHEF